jgi:hypothetical protein
MLDSVRALKGKLPNMTTAAKKGQPVGEYLVGLDIGTEYVKALVGRVVGNDVEIIGMGRTHQQLSDMQAGAIADIAAVVANCDKALAAAEQQAGVSARTAIIGIAGELVKGTTSTVRFTRKNPGKELTVDEMARIISLVQERAEAKARHQLAWELGGKDVEVRLVNSALVRIDIDGYKVTLLWSLIWNFWLWRRNLSPWPGPLLAMIQTLPLALCLWTWAAAQPISPLLTKAA